VPAPPPTLDEILDRFVALDARGESAHAEALLRDTIATRSSPAEAATLALQLGRWLAARPGRAADAAEVLDSVDRPGVPAELIETARALRKRALAR